MKLDETILLTSPCRVLRSLDNARIIELAHSVTTWTDILAERLDVTITERVIDALLSGDPAELDACDRFLGLVALPSVRPVLDALPGRWASRWRGYTQLLVVRQGQLANRDLGLSYNLSLSFSEAVKRRAFVEEILAAVTSCPEGITRAELNKRVQISPAHLSRLLTVLEDHGLLARRLVGAQIRYVRT